MGPARKFDTTADGRDVFAYDLSGHGLCATILSMGGILQDLRFDGADHSLTPSHDTIAEYEGPQLYAGALIGPVGNRLRDGRAPIAGVPHQFERNENGKTTLHSASFGFHAKHWDCEQISGEKLILTTELSDGEGNLPGTRSIRAEFEIITGPTLRLTLSATTDKATLFNCTNHSYWNLDGSDSVVDHILRIAADRYLPTNSDTVPTGAIATVDGTDFDFRDGRRFEAAKPDIDHNFCTANGPSELREVLWLTGKSGVSMALATTEPGIQIYDHRAKEPAYRALAIEPQGWPDAPNNPSFPSIEYGPDKPYHHISEWRFSRG